MQRSRSAAARKRQPLQRVVRRRSPPAARESASIKSTPSRTRLLILLRSSGVRTPGPSAAKVSRQLSTFNPISGPHSARRLLSEDHGRMYRPLSSTPRIGMVSGMGRRIPWPQTPRLSRRQVHRALRRRPCRDRRSPLPRHGWQPFAPRRRRPQTWARSRRSVVGDHPRSLATKKALLSSLGVAAEGGRSGAAAIPTGLNRQFVPTAGISGTGSANRRVAPPGTLHLPSESVLVTEVVRAIPESPWHR